MKKFECVDCNYVTDRKLNYERHLNSSKHINKKVQNKIMCEECGKTYKYKSSLNRHLKNCIKTPKSIMKEDIDFKEMFLQLVEQNNKILDTSVKIANEPKIITNTNTNINNQFNMLNYLNTECKDALNWSEFIQQVEYTYKNLPELVTEGWRENLKNTFILQLKNMEQTKRPIHCSDRKRKKFFIKENDVWERDENNDIILKGIRKFHNEQCRTYVKWKKANNDKIYDNDDLHYNAMTMNIELCSAFSGDEKNKNKIIGFLSDLTIDKKINKNE